jgi:hypothetical protein
MVLVRRGPCFILYVFALLVVFTILVGTCIGIRQIRIRFQTIVYARPGIFALVGGTVDRGTSSHVASVLMEVDGGTGRGKKRRRSLLVGPWRTREEL